MDPYETSVGRSNTDSWFRRLVGRLNRRAVTHDTLPQAVKVGIHLVSPKVHVVTMTITPIAEMTYVPARRRSIRETMKTNRNDRYVLRQRLWTRDIRRTSNTTWS